MLISSKLILLCSYSINFNYSYVNEFSNAIPYESCYVVKQPYKDTIHYNTMTTEELIQENTNKIIQQLYYQLP